MAELPAQLLALGPVGQAVGAAALAAATLSPKLAAAVVAAAARGAVQGACAGPGMEAQHDPLQIVPQAVSLLGYAGLPAALAGLRKAGQPELARRLQRVSKTRNGVAHPDVALLADLDFFARLSGEEGHEAAEQKEATKLRDAAVDEGRRGAGAQCAEPEAEAGEGPQYAVGVDIGIQADASGITPTCKEGIGGVHHCDEGGAPGAIQEQAFDKETCRAKRGKSKKAQRAGPASWAGAKPDAPAGHGGYEEKPAAEKPAAHYLARKVDDLDRRGAAKVRELVALERQLSKLRGESDELHLLHAKAKALLGAGDPLSAG